MAASVSPSRFLREEPAERCGATVEIGGIPILLQTGDEDFRSLIEQRYAGFVNPSAEPACQFAIHLQPPTERAA